VGVFTRLNIPSICSVPDLSAGAYKIYYTQGDIPQTILSGHDFTIAILFRMERSPRTMRCTCPALGLIPLGKHKAIDQPEKMPRF